MSSFSGSSGRQAFSHYANKMQYYPNQLQGQQQPYGTLPSYLSDADETPKPRRRMNVVSVAVSLFAPHFLFVSVLGVLSFSIHYTHPPYCFALVCLGFVWVVSLGVQALDSIRNDAGDYRHGPTWYAFVFVTSLVAWALAVVLGDWNFTHNLQPYFDVMNLNVYRTVDPLGTPGQQLMDAGIIEFNYGAHLDIQHSFGFKNDDVYCVAPIVSGRHHNENATKSGHVVYDFWAVGINCCSGTAPDFNCGQPRDRQIHSALRVMQDEQRPFFRLAVQQAESTYSIKSVHPIFMYWLKDPQGEARSWREDGFKYFLLGMFGHFGLQLGLVMLYVVAIVRADAV